jgi:hypothetical protein
MPTRLLLPARSHWLVRAVLSLALTLLPFVAPALAAEPAALYRLRDDGQLDVINRCRQAIDEVLRAVAIAPIRLAAQSGPP